MAALNASAIARMLPAAAPTTRSNGLASTNSASYGNFSVPSSTCTRPRTVRLVAVRAGDVPGTEGVKSSTGGITKKAAEMAEKVAAVFDGEKEDTEGMLMDNGRPLKSKTGDVVYGTHRNADGVGAVSTKSK